MLIDPIYLLIAPQGEEMPLRPLEKYALGPKAAKCSAYQGKILKEKKENKPFSKLCENKLLNW